MIGGLLILGFSTAAWAADPPTVGAEGGLNINTASFSGTDAQGINPGTKAGFAIGGFVGIPVSPMFAIMPEVLYEQKSVSLTGSGNATGYTANLKYDVVEIPVLVKIDLARMKSPGYYVVAGPGFAFATTVKLTDQKAGSQTLPDEDLKATNQVQNTDYTIVVGFGVTKGPLGIEARYDAGLRNINKESAGEDFKVHSRVFSILGRYSFNLKK